MRLLPATRGVAATTGRFSHSTSRVISLLRDLTWFTLSSSSAIPIPKLDQSKKGNTYNIQHWASRKWIKSISSRGIFDNTSSNSQKISKRSVTEGQSKVWFSKRRDQTVELNPKSPDPWPCTSKAVEVVRNFCFIKIRIENISTAVSRLMVKLWLL